VALVEIATIEMFDSGQIEGIVLGVAQAIGLRLFGLRVDASRYSTAAAAT
jgi:hypothetical protein